MGLVQFTEEVSRLWRRPNSGEAAHIELGQRGEALAAKFLRSHGHRVLYKNFRAPHGGEVDIVCCGAVVGNGGAQDRDAVNQCRGKNHLTRKL